MNSLETKEVMINDKKIKVRKLEPWKRLMFLADLQKQFLLPLLSSAEGKKLQEMFESKKKGASEDYISILSAFSNSIDSAALDKWMKRILDDGMLFYEDGSNNIKLSFSAINKVTSSPMDIISIMKEAIVFNLDDLGEFVKLMQSQQGDATHKIKEVKL